MGLAMLLLSGNAASWGQSGKKSVAALPSIAFDFSVMIRAANSKGVKNKFIYYRVFEKLYCLQSWSSSWVWSQQIGFQWVDFITDQRYTTGCITLRPIKTWKNTVGIWQRLRGWNI
jgi:hypothetical protein